MSRAAPDPPAPPDAPLPAPPDAPPDAPPPAPPDVARAVARRIAAAGRAAWPAVDAPLEALEARVRGLIADDPGADLDALRDADLYLAVALAAGAPAALRGFEERLVPEVAQALRRLRLPAGVADEVVQHLRASLLAGPDARIADYAGRGELAGWLRVSATRHAIKLARRAGREEALDEALLERWPDGDPDPAARHLRGTYAAELKRALAEAFASLEVRQRNLLRQHLLDELTIDDLARLYRVHRATCARWLVDAREDLGRRTRQRLAAALGAAGADLDSVVRYLDSDVELSLSRILQAR